MTDASPPNVDTDERIDVPDQAEAADEADGAGIGDGRPRGGALMFVNQTNIIGSDPPTNTTSSVRVTLDKVDDRWLISQFDPV